MNGLKQIIFEIMTFVFSTVRMQKKSSTQFDVIMTSLPVKEPPYLESSPEQRRINSLQPIKNLDSTK